MLCYDWPVTDHAKLTTNPNESWLWVVPMNQLNFNSLAALKKKKEGCRRVVAFQPTGWSYGGRQGNSTSSVIQSIQPRNETIMKPRHKDGNVIY